MTQYLLSVHGSTESDAAVDPHTMEQMFAAVGPSTTRSNRLAPGCTPTG